MNVNCAIPVPYTHILSVNRKHVELQQREGGILVDNINNNNNINKNNNINNNNITNNNSINNNKNQNNNHNSLT